MYCRISTILYWSRALPSGSFDANESTDIPTWLAFKLFQNYYWFTGLRVLKTKFDWVIILTERTCNVASTTFTEVNFPFSQESGRKRYLYFSIGWSLIVCNISRYCVKIFMHIAIHYYYYYYYYFTFSHDKKWVRFSMVVPM